MQGYLPDVPQPEVSLALHTRRPTVYLDQWVWIELAKVAKGRSSESVSQADLELLLEATQAGVAFPLSSTHYFETLAITDPRQRRDVVSVMARVSQMRTLRAREDLVRHQMLVAFHETFGRPAFRPPAPEVLGVGVNWAFQGTQGRLRLTDDSGTTDLVIDEATRSRLRRAQQWAEAKLLMGPEDAEIEPLMRLGYRPDAMMQGSESRLDWERHYASLIAKDRVSRAEMHVHLTARELIHEDLDRFNEILTDYHIPWEREVGFDPSRPRSGRARVMEFARRIPTQRIAVDMKLETFFDANRRERGFAINWLHDIDALSMAVPYCHAVVADRDASDILKRSGADVRHGTLVARRFADIADRVIEMIEVAKAIGGDCSGWAWLGPEAEFQLAFPGPLPGRVQLLGPDLQEGRNR